MNQELNDERDREMLDEYDFSGGVRGKYAGRFAKGSNVVVLDPESQDSFRRWLEKLMASGRRIKF